METTTFDLGNEKPSFELIEDRDGIANTILRIIDRASARLDIIANSSSPYKALSFEDYKHALRSCHERGVPIRMVTEITKENLSGCKKLIETYRFELRHVSNPPINITLNEKEFVLDESEPQNSLAATRLIRGTIRELLIQNQFLFDTLWEKAKPAHSRFLELEEGTEAPRIEVISDLRETTSRYLAILGSANQELLIVFPTTESFHKDQRDGIIDALEKAALERNVRVRILSPFDEDIQKNISERQNWEVSSYDSHRAGRERQTPPRSVILFREIATAKPETLVKIVISDKSSSLVVELKNDQQGSSTTATSTGLATFSNSKTTVSSYVAFFEKLWRESELRHSESVARRELVAALAREERARKEAELLQDILAHDVRNYNQVIQLGAEMLVTDIDTSTERTISQQNPIAFDILTAVKQSTELLEKAKKLGRVLSEGDKKLFPVNLMQSIENSMNLVRTANPGKRIIDERVVNIFPVNGGNDLQTHNEICVMTDELLDDVFVNLYTNSTKYTRSGDVHIQTSVEDAGRYWKISITDEGAGIADDMKSHVFSRYLRNAKGGGLGMSIVHALVVNRYVGKVSIKNRVEGDYTKGTTVEVFLVKAPSMGAT